MMQSLFGRAAPHRAAADRRGPADDDDDDPRRGGHQRGRRRGDASRADATATSSSSSQEEPVLGESRGGGTPTPYHEEARAAAGIKGGHDVNAAQSTQKRGNETAAPRFLAIFDFDCTLTTFHVWGRFKQTPLEAIPIDESTFVDACAFREFVNAARRRDAAVAIATFGRRDVVNKALSKILGADHGLAISTPADHFDPRFEFADDSDRPRCAEGSDVLGDKNAQIDALCARFGVLKDKTTVFLADDDAHNIAAARHHGVYAEHTPRGADRAILAALLKRLPPPPDALSSSTSSSSSSHALPSESS